MALYLVGMDISKKRIGVWKTTGDPTTLTNWAAQDRLITPGKEIMSLWAVLDGTDIYIATSYGNRGEPDSAGGNQEGGRLEFHLFHTATDTWDTRIREEIRIGQDSFSDTRASCSIGVRGDGDILISTTLFQSSDYNTSYFRWEGTSWSTEQLVAAVATDDILSGPIVMGASDRAHFLYTNITDDDVFHRSLSSANALDTEAAVDAAVATIFFPIGRGIFYADNGNITVKVPYLDADESITSIRIDASGANPTIATDTAASDNDAEGISSSLVACMAIDGTDTYLIYSGGGVSGVDQDIYYDTQEDGGSWGTDTEEQDAVTCNRLSAAVYNRSGTDYIGYVWLDGTTTSYDEITLAAPPDPIPDRLYEVEQHINRAGTY